jgi:hypothetical protein
VEGIVERALVPLAASLERLADAVRGLPLVVSASNERLLQRAVRRRETSAATDEHDALVVDVEAALADPLGSEDDGDQPRLTSDEWSDGAWGGDTPASGPPTSSGGGVLPPRAFDQIPDGIDGNGDWFWVRPPRAEDD